MKLYYDAEEDILYLRLREVPISNSEDIEPGVMVDLDDAGQIIGVEVLDASERLDLRQFVAAVRDPSAA